VLIRRRGRGRKLTSLMQQERIDCIAVETGSGPTTATGATCTERIMFLRA
jgi:hypothetical protein